MYEDFLKRVSQRRWHRSRVKDGLKACVFDLIAERDGAKEAFRFENQNPYEKCKYYNKAIELLQEKYQYPTYQRPLLNGAIIARIQFENLES